MKWHFDNKNPFEIDQTVLINVNVLKTYAELYKNG